MATGAMAIASISGVGTAASSAGASVRPHTGSTHETVSHEPVNTKALAELTNIVASANNGNEVSITSHRVNLPGPIGEAKGQPIVFNVEEKKGKNQTYFAYNQVGLPNFDQKEPLGTAASMAIIKEPNIYKHVELTEAHLNKAGELVGPNEMAVGFSTDSQAGK